MYEGFINKNTVETITKALKHYKHRLEHFKAEQGKYSKESLVDLQNQINLIDEWLEKFNITLEYTFASENERIFLFDFAISILKLFREDLEKLMKDQTSLFPEFFVFPDTKELIQEIEGVLGLLKKNR